MFDDQSSLKHHINSAVFALPFDLITDRGYCLSPNIVYASSKDISCFGSSSLTSFHLRENEGKYGHLRTPSTAIAARGLMPLLSVRTQYLHPSQFFIFRISIFLHHQVFHRIYSKALQNEVILYVMWQVQCKDLHS